MRIGSVEYKYEKMEGGQELRYDMLRNVQRNKT